MKRHLIHHGRGGTLDVVVDGDDLWIEHVTKEGRERLSLKDFELSHRGKMFARELNAALDRAAQSRRQR